MNFRCDECGSQFKTAFSLHGHTGGAHRRALVPIRHGTQWGYEQHIRRGVEPCSACRAAHNVHNNGRKLEKV